jgi:hypothetical protein
MAEMRICPRPRSQRSRGGEISSLGAVGEWNELVARGMGQPW